MTAQDNLVGVVTFKYIGSTGFPNNGGSLYSLDQNKAQAMRVLATRIMDGQMREKQAKEAATRKSLIGSGDRSERIRTYNFPHGRMTAHRINLTLYKLDFIMDGELSDLTNALVAEHQAELLAALAEDAS